MSLTAKDVMSKNPKHVPSDKSVLDAAKIMADQDLGILPVSENDKLVGMLTDRDITVRVIAKNKDPNQTKTKDVMTDRVLYCFETDSIENVLDSFGKQQINRMPVMNKDKRFVGEITLGDIARAAENDAELHELIGRTKELISKESSSF